MVLSFFIYDFITKRPEQRYGRSGSIGFCFQLETEDCITNWQDQNRLS